MSDAYRILNGIVNLSFLVGVAVVVIGGVIGIFWQDWPLWGKLCAFGGVICALSGFAGFIVVELKRQGLMK